jgi:hypothetical protein
MMKSGEPMTGRRRLEKMDGTDIGRFPLKQIPHCRRPNFARARGKT